MPLKLTDGGNVLRGILLDHLPQKIIALMMATALVAVKQEDKVTVVSATVQISVSYPDDRVLVSPKVDTVRLTIEGKYSQIRKFDVDSLPRLEMNLTGFEERQVEFEPEMFKVPPDLVVRDVRPTAMLVSFEERKRTILPVEPTLEGEAQSGYSVSQITVDPPTVVIEGAASVIEGLTRISTHPISLVGRNQSTTLKKSLKTPKGRVAFLDGGKAYNDGYAVTIEFEEKRGTRVITSREIKIRNVPDGSPGFEASPSTVDITLHGPVRLLDGLDPMSLSAYVDVKGVKLRKRVLRSRRVRFEPPPGLTHSELKPEKVTLLRKEPPPKPAPDAGVPAVDAGL